MKTIEYVVQYWCDDCQEWDDIAFYETKELDEAKDSIDIWKDHPGELYRIVLRKTTEEVLEY
jgi:hypothetical protein